MSGTELIKTEDLTKTFAQKSGGGGRTITAVDAVDLSIFEGEALGLVGESGCGKSTLGRLLLRLLEPNAGRVFYRGTDLASLSEREMRERRKKMQLIFQNPYSSLDPRMTIFQAVSEPLRIFGVDRRSAWERTREMLREVDLPENCLDRYPHEFSGGQRQRAVIARSLILEPEFVVCDEPVSALDVSVRAQVLNLMSDLKKKRKLTYLFISHDLSVVHHICDRVAVMYLGRIVEIAPREELFRAPAHPYTQALLSAIPRIDPEHREKHVLITGEATREPSSAAACPFYARCPKADARCASETPRLRGIASGHLVACRKAADGERPEESSAEQ